MRIHSIILITQLKPIAVIVMKVSNRYERKVNIESLFVHNEGDEGDDIKIKRIMNKRITRDKFKYLLR